MKRFFWIGLCLSMIASMLTAQDTPKQWTLEECIRYAWENNIELKQKEQELESREISLHTSKNSWLPDLNASIGQNFDFGRSPSESGILLERNSASTSAYVGVSMPVFDGMKIINDIAAKKLDLQASMQSLEKVRENIAMNIASTYLQVLYNKEVEHIAQLQVELTTEQVTRTEAMVDAGRVPQSQYYDIAAQLARDEATRTDATNNVRLSLLDLAQMLELEREEKNFDVVMPTEQDAIEQYIGSILPPDVIFENALTFKPMIKEQEFMLESQKRQLKVAQAGYYPKLNLNASYSNGFYHYYNGVEGQASFSDQLKQNERKTIGLSLSIPIFNRFQVRNSVRSSRVAVNNQQLAIEATRKNLYKEIQQAFYNAVASQDKYDAARKAVKASEEAYRYADERYNAGKSSVFEYNEAKTKYAQSLGEQAQAKYNYIFSTKILDFYNGVPLRL